MMQCRAVGTTGESGWMTHPPDVSRLPEATLKECQEALGGLLWLSTRTRMDIAYAVSMAASKASKCPKTSWYMITRILKYLSTNRALAIRLEPDGKPLHLKCFTDASWAPANDRSQSGVVICVNETPVIWKSSRQQLTALSSAEAELIALTHGFQYAMGVEAVMACSGTSMKVTMYTDNTPAIATVKDSKFKWRSRYYSVRAARMREVLEAREFDLEYIQGSNQVADILTKYTNRTTIIHCLKLTNHRQKVDDDWVALDEKLLKNRALNTGALVTYPKQVEYEDTKGPMVPTFFDDGSKPTSLIMTKMARVKKWPDSRPFPITDEQVKNCWIAGPYGIWTAPKAGNEAEEWIHIPGHGRGKWGVNRRGKCGIFTDNPTGEFGEWRDSILPRCPYCGKAKEGSVTPGDLCGCDVQENGKMFKEKLPFWKQGSRITNKIQVKDVEDFDYEGFFRLMRI
jgi:ribonuclease HI